MLMVMVMSCQSYKPFTNKKEKRQGIKLVKKSLKLSNEDIIKLSGKDSLLYNVVLSAKTKKASKSRMRKRIDSFFKGAYTREQLAIMLELDRNFPDFDFNLKKDNGQKNREFKTLKELRKALSSIDSVVEKKVILKRDSIR